MSDRIDISQHTDALLHKLGIVDKNLVRSMEITPGAVIVTLYETNADGKKFIRDDGYVAIASREFKVST